MRTLCPKCKEPYEADAANLNRLMRASDPDSSTVTLFRGRGCSHCHETGYYGRTGIFELLEIDDQQRQLISQGATDATIRQAAVEAGMRSIGEDGLRKALEGRTTLEEVTRVVYLAEQAPKICPRCQTVLNKEYEYCTSCGEFVGEHCEKCHRRMMVDWTFCPFCGTTATRSAGFEVSPEELPTDDLPPEEVRTAA